MQQVMEEPLQALLRSAEPTIQAGAYGWLRGNVDGCIHSQIVSSCVMVWLKGGFSHLYHWGSANRRFRDGAASHRFGDGDSLKSASQVPPIKLPMDVPDGLPVAPSQPAVPPPLPKRRRLSDKPFPNGVIAEPAAGEPPEALPADEPDAVDVNRDAYKLFHNAFCRWNWRTLARLGRALARHLFQSVILCSF